jgi:hypothetical protein
MEGSYSRLNAVSLAEEFPELEKDVVDSVYMAAEKDRERARDTLFEMTGRKRAKAEPFLSDSGFVLKEHRGDLFAAAEGCSLCHCVSVDLAMGKVRLCSCSRYFR